MPVIHESTSVKSRPSLDAMTWSVQPAAPAAVASMRVSPRSRAKRISPVTQSALYSAARGKLPTDVWWHTIVSPTGREKTGYPTQKPVGIVRRMLQASTRPGDLVLDPFAGSGTLGAAAAELGRSYVLIDESAEAVAVMEARLGVATPGRLPA